MKKVQKLPPRQCQDISLRQLQTLTHEDMTKKSKAKLFDYGELQGPRRIQTSTSYYWMKR